MIGLIGHHLSVGTGLGIAEAARVARELGVEAFEISGIPFNVASQYARESYHGADYGKQAEQRKPQVQIDVNATAEQWQAARRAVENERLQVRAVGGYNDFALPPERLNDEIAQVERFCELTRAIDCDVVRTFGGDWREGVDREQAISQIIRCYKEVGPTAEKLGVFLAIENHLKLTNDADTLLRIIDSVGSPFLKITLDFSNFYWLNADRKASEKMIRQMVPHTIHTHFKNARYDGGKCILGRLNEGDLNIPRVIDQLLEAGYARPFFVACESEDFSDLEALKAGFAQSIEYLRGLLAERGVDESSLDKKSALRR